jgi:hypothetical protein
LILLKTLLPEEVLEKRTIFRWVGYRIDELIDYCASQVTDDN